MNGSKFPKGCAGAVWSDGSVSVDYCTNTGYANGRFPWWGKCCKAIYCSNIYKCFRKCIPKSVTFEMNLRNDAYIRIQMFEFEEKLNVYHLILNNYIKLNF